jgi:hypothetical protein
MWKLIVSGREDMSAHPSEEAIRQLRLRYRNGAMLASSMAAEGFVAVHVDIVLGRDLAGWKDVCPARPLFVVMLAPGTQAVVHRQTGRSGNAYGPWVQSTGSLEGAVAEHNSWLADTPRVGLWLDTSDQTPDQTVDEIIARLDDARVG